jgi:hypothetical protein
MDESNFRRWLLVTLLVLGIIALLAYARNEPGVGGRVPDPEDARVAAVVDQDGMS